MGPGVRPIVLALLAAATAGCLFARAEPREVHTFQLSPEGRFSGGEVRRPDVTAPVILVGLPQPEPGFDTPRMAYLTRPYELNYYAVNEWADTPARMLHPLMIRALEQTGDWRAVVAAPALLRADYRVDVDSLAVAHEYVQSPSRVRLSWRAQLIDLREGRVLGSRRFEAVRNAQTEDAYGGVRAAGQALEELLSDTASWLGACAAGRDKATC